MRRPVAVRGGAGRARARRRPLRRRAENPRDRAARGRAPAGSLPRSRRRQFARAIPEAERARSPARRLAAPAQARRQAGARRRDRADAERRRRRAGTSPLRRRQRVSDRGRPRPRSHRLLALSEAPRRARPRALHGARDARSPAPGRFFGEAARAQFRPQPAAHGLRGREARLTFQRSMIFSENRPPLFGIMLYFPTARISAKTASPRR